MGDGDAHTLPAATKSVYKPESCWEELPTASARRFEGRDDETLKPRACRGVVIED